MGFLNDRLRPANAALIHADDWLVDQLNRLDEYAVDHVRSGRGGPFGAELRLYDRTLDQWHVINGPAGNAVLSKGLGSAHAEAETLTPDALAATLDYRAAHPDHDLHLLQLSTAESCPACRAKQITFMHRLMAEGWPADRPMAVAFGANYEDTATIAGFNDQPYDVDIKRAEPEFLEVTTTTHTALPFDMAPDQPFAAVMVGDQRVSLVTQGADWPAQQSVEMTAIQRAAASQGETGQDQPWRLDHRGPATLITSADALGPLMWTECQWAAISRIVLVRDMPSTQAESPLMGNDKLLALVKADYNADGVPLQVKHLGGDTPGFVNNAQRIWRDEVIAADPSQLYNGLETD